MPAETAISITLNGEARSVPAGAALTDALATAGVKPDRTGIAVAVNGEVVPRSLWDETALDDGDEVEVITAFQGG